MKRQLSLNLVQKSSFSLGYANGLNISLLLFAIIFLVLLTSSFKDKSAALKNRLASLTIQMQSQQAELNPDLKLVVSTEELMFYQMLQHEMQLPWDRLLDALEAANQDDVYLLQVLPDRQAHRLTIEGKAKGLKEVLLYTERLSKVKVIHDVFLQRHEISKELNATPLDFTITAKWDDDIL